MITRLWMENFRQHAATEIRCDDADQIIVINGANGAGKTTVLEAIMYALWGEGRNGNRRLDTLVRRGAEIEGMTVELEFTVGTDTYRVVRRREGRTSTAVLYGNENQLVEGVREVTNSISALLGMDSLGFKLAVIAQQKQLDALTKLGAPARAKALARLLRLDAITRARDAARERYRTEAAVVESLPSGEDLTKARAEVDAAHRELLEREAAEAECRAAVTEAEAILAISSGVDEIYHARREQLAGATATVRALESELAGIEGELSKLHIPDAAGGEHRPLDEVRREASEIDTALGRVEQQTRLAEQRRLVESDLGDAVAEVAEIDVLLETHGRSAELLGQLNSLDAQITEVRANMTALQSRHEELRVEWRAADDAVRAARERLELAKSVGPVCDACGQDVPHEHHDSMVARSEQALADAETAAATAVTNGRAVGAEVEAAAGQLKTLEAQRVELDATIQKVSNAEMRRADLETRAGAYRTRLQALPEPPEADESSLYQRRGQLGLEIAAAEQAVEIARRREEAMAAQAALFERRDGVLAKLEQARRDAQEAAIDADLEAQYEQRRAAVERFEAEREMLGVLAAASAEARGVLSGTQAGLRRANELAGTRRKHAQAATAAANAAKLLNDVEQTLAVTIRPALEGAVSELLAKLSDGRFTAVRVTSDYLCEVLDDGAYRPVSELSGGEGDLVALALRLGIAAVLTEHTGGNGVGFLILDEVFGSQDASRRDSIMTALRALRSRYGQIWCISHVGGLEEAADRVVDVELDADGVATVAA